MARFDHVVTIYRIILVIFLFAGSIFWVAAANNLPDIISADSKTEPVEEITETKVSNILRCEKLGNKNSACDLVRYNIATRMCTLFRNSTHGANVDGSNKKERFMMIRHRSSCKRGEVMLTSDIADDGHHCKRVAAICELGQYLIGGRCVAFDRGPASWYEACAACKQMGGRLAVIDSQETHDALRELIIQKNLESTFNDVWVDGGDEALEGSWVSCDGSRLPWITWAQGQPDNNGQNENCMCFVTWGGQSVNDCECQWKRPYMCELNFGA